MGWEDVLDFNSTRLADEHYQETYMINNIISSTSNFGEMLNNISEDGELLAVETSVYVKSRQLSGDGEGSFIIGSDLVNKKSFKVSSDEELKLNRVEDIPVMRKREAWRPVAGIIIIFLISLYFLYTVFSRLPKLEESEWQYVKFPKSVNEAKSLGLVLSRYTDNYYWEVLTGITIVYIFLQSFMIPGSVAFSVLLGYLFPFILALAVICFCSAVGASFCFIITRLIGKRLITNLFPEKLKWCKEITARYQSRMALYILCLRVAPYIPNWLVNITSPVLDVPLMHFFVGTFFGVIPLSLVFVNAGTTLQQLSSFGVTSLTSAYTLPLFTIISLLPFVFKEQLKEKLL